MTQLKSEESRSTADLEKDLDIQKRCLKKLIEKLKNIVFWFTEDDGKSAFNALPKQEEWRTVSQAKSEGDGILSAQG